MDSALLIGISIDGYVFRISETSVLKVPKLLGWWHPNGDVEQDPDNEYHKHDLENEREVYLRLRNVPGVIECVHNSTIGIELVYYENGSLANCLRQQNVPPLLHRIQWISQLVETLEDCHEHRVLIFDISLQNILLDQNMRVRIIDFANSILLPQEADIIGTELDGWSVKLDLLRLGFVICWILHWKPYELECASASEWPKLERMPKTRQIPGEEVVQKCWKGEYNTADELQMDVQHVWHSTGST